MTQIPEKLHCARCGCFQEPTLVEGVLRPVCPVCGYVAYNHPYPCVRALVRRRGAVLLCAHEGGWALPGGYIEYGESHAQAAVREVQRAAGVTVNPISVLDICSGPYSGVEALVLTLLAAAPDEGAMEDTDRLRWQKSGEPLPRMLYPQEEALVKRYFTHKQWNLPFPQIGLTGSTDSG